MAAFDVLPFELRERLRGATLMFSAGQALDAVRRGVAVPDLIWAIGHAEAHHAEALRAEMDAWASGGRAA